MDGCYGHPLCNRAATRATKLYSGLAYCMSQLRAFLSFFSSGKQFQSLTFNMVGYHNIGFHRSYFFPFSIIFHHQSYSHPLLISNARMFSFSCAVVIKCRV